MPLQSAALCRCATCERWDGPRTVGGDAGSVRIGSETDGGICVGGPWDGTPRRARSACGRWLRWHKLGESGEGGSST